MEKQLPSIAIAITESISDEFYLSLITNRKPRRPEEGRYASWDIHPWMLLLKNEEVRDPDSFLGRRFRRRFRVPAPFFLDWLVPTARKENLFDRSTNRKTFMLRQEQIPLEIKLLISLRMLGRGSTHDDVAEPSYVSESHCGVIFRQFIRNFSRLFKEEFIRLPDERQLRSIMEIYAAIGFPGCVGSIDCTHIRWWNCPSTLQNLCHGKEGYPSLAFQIVVDHSRRILYVSPSYFGSLNDQNICNVDPRIFNDTSGIVNYAKTNRVLYKNIQY